MPRTAVSDGKVWEFAKPHVPLLDLAVGGTWPGAPDATTVFPAVLRVDYVRLYDRPAG